MTEQENRKKILGALLKIGLTCESMHHFIWNKGTQQMEISLKMEMPIFLQTQDEMYTEEEKENWYAYEKYNIEKMVLEFKDEELSESDRRLIFEIDYVSGQEEPIEVYVQDTYYTLSSDPYDQGWISLLKDYGYEERVKQQELAQVFSEDAGKQMMRSAVRDMETELAVSKERIENEVGRRVKAVLENL